jgi:hypothetical protein
MLSNMTLDEQWALAASGYKVLPDDSGPVRTVDNYGWLIRCPADVKLRRTAEGVRWQSPLILPVLLSKHFTLEEIQHPQSTRPE